MYFRRSPIKRRVLIVVILFILFFSLCIFFKMASPIIAVYAQSTAVNHATVKLNETIEKFLSDQQLHYDDIASLQTDTNGEVIAIRINSMVINQIKTGAIAAIAEVFSDIQTIHPGIPVGTLTGSNFFTGKGAKIPFSVSYSASAESELSNLFITRGINQTQHQIVLHVLTKINVLSFDKIETKVIKAQITIAETVLVGMIPEIYAGAEDEIWPNLVE